MTECVSCKAARADDPRHASFESGCDSCKARAVAIVADRIKPRAMQQLFGDKAEQALEWVREWEGVIRRHDVSAAAATKP
jgi:hypothetical protein